MTEREKHLKFCHYIGNDAWDCGHIDNNDLCDCHMCLSERFDDGSRASDYEDAA